MVYLVRTLGLVPEPFNLTTGTFNLVVKDRFATTEVGAFSSEQRHTSATLPVLETCTSYWFCWALSTWATHRFCTESSQLSAVSFQQGRTRNRTHLPDASKCLISARADTEDACLN